MNLCGGIISVAEPEQLLLEIPDEKFQLTPRRKAASSAPSRRRKGIPTSIDTGRRTPTEHRSSFSTRPSSARNGSREPQTPEALPSPSFLNPLSEEELKKSRSRQRSSAPPLHASKGGSSLGLSRKFETSYNVVSFTIHGAILKRGNRKSDIPPLVHDIEIGIDRNRYVKKNGLAGREFREGVSASTSKGRKYKRP